MYWKITGTVIPAVFAFLIGGPAAAESTRLTAVEDNYPWPSPDGDKIVFESDRTGVAQIHVIDSDGTNLRQLTDIPGGAEAPVYSPDGQWIVFAAFPDGEDKGNDIFIMRADGTDQQRLTDAPGADGHPHWTADGERIVFNSDRTTPDPDAEWWDRWHEIFSMRRDGSDVRQHTRCETVCTFGSISPDGTKIAYRKVTDSSGFGWSFLLHDWNSEVFVSDLDGDNEINVSNSAAYDGWSRWSPDGSRLVFASNRAGPASVGQLYTVNPDGSELKQITDGPWSHTQPSWSADGTKIYAHQAEGGVVVMDLE